MKIPMMTQSFSDLLKSVSPAIKSSVIVTIILAIILIIVGIKLRKYKYTDEPKGIVIVLEWLVGAVNGMCKSTVGKRYRQLAPYLTTVAILIFTYCISGLFGFRTPTSSASVTFAFSLTTFILVEVFSIMSQGVKSFFKGTCKDLLFNILTFVLSYNNATSMPRSSALS